MPQPELRTMQQLTEQYEVEKVLANRLRTASKEERKDLYSSLYDELFRRVPHHSQLTRKVSPEESQRQVSYLMGMLAKFIRPEMTFLEIGPGDCALAFHIAERVKKVYGVDVSAEITKTATPPDNFELILSDGCSIPVPEASIDLAYSHQLMEHLHCDDAYEQLTNVFRALVPGGRYICITPNRLNGPHDISRHFDLVATGFHLTEYTVGDLARLFRKVGFSRVQAAVGGRANFVLSAPAIPVACEQLLSLLPVRTCRRIASNPYVRLVLGIRLIGTK